MKKWIETHLWTFSLILVTLLSPVIIWEAWELITSFSAVPIRILLGVGILVVTYIGLVVLLLLNRFLQGKYREWGIRK